MSAADRRSEHRITVTGSGNNVATGTGAYAGDTTYGGGQDTDIRALLTQIRHLAAGAPDHVAGEQAQAAVAAIESDLPKPHDRRFSAIGAVQVLSKLGAAIPGLDELVQALNRLVH